MTNQEAPVPRQHATEEQIEAADRAYAESRYNRALVAVDTGTVDDLARLRRDQHDSMRDALNAALSVSASADPAGEHHDAEERAAKAKAEARDMLAELKVITAERDAAHEALAALAAGEHHDAEEREAECKCSAYSEDRGGGYFELMVEPEPDCPEHGAGIAAEAEDHAATVTGDREKLVAEAREAFDAAGHMPQGTMDHETQWLPFARLYNVTERMIDALAAPVEVDEAKLAEALEWALQYAETDSLVTNRHVEALVAEVTPRLAERLRGENC